MATGGGSLKQSSHDGIFIYVPQGCYAEISPEMTPHNIIGLMTAGMQPCCHVLVANRITHHIILCHADTTTNLKHKQSGVPEWIKKVCPDENYENLIVNVGEKEDEARFSLEGSTYSLYKEVSYSLPDGAKDKLSSFGMGEGVGYGISVLRDCTIQREKYDPIDAKDDIMERFNVQIPNFYANIPEGHRYYPGSKSSYSTFDIGTSILSARSYADNLVTRSDENAQDLFFPPICVFDGKSDHYLSIDQIETIYNASRDDVDPVIDWNRVRNDDKSTPGSSVSGDISGLAEDLQSDAGVEDSTKKRTRAADEEDDLVQGSSEKYGRKESSASDEEIKRRIKIPILSSTVEQRSDAQLSPPVSPKNTKGSGHFKSI
jgi:hypothetical protein